VWWIDKYSVGWNGFFWSILGYVLIGISLAWFIYIIVEFISKNFVSNKNPKNTKYVMLAYVFVGFLMLYIKTVDYLFLGIEQISPPIISRVILFLFFTPYFIIGFTIIKALKEVFNKNRGLSLIFLIPFVLISTGIFIFIEFLL